MRLDMFIVKCYNTATGHVETVSDPIPDTEQGDVYRQFETEMFAHEDTSDSHVYYADTVSV